MGPGFCRPKDRPQRPRPQCAPPLGLSRPYFTHCGVAGGWQLAPGAARGAFRGPGRGKSGDDPLSPPPWLSCRCHWAGAGVTKLSRLL